MKKFDITPLLPFYDRAQALCLDAYGRPEAVTPLGLLEELMDIPGLPMHCPPHHFILPAVLITLAARATGMPRARFEEDLAEIRERAEDVPGGSCGFYGTCGAAVGVGLFFSVFTVTDPHSETHWGNCNLVTGRALGSIGGISGPRCCKRNSFLALESALSSLREILDMDLGTAGPILSKYHNDNPDCKGPKCPFFPKP